MPKKMHLLYDHLFKVEYEEHDYELLAMIQNEYSEEAVLNYRLKQCKFAEDVLKDKDASERHLRAVMKICFDCDWSQP